MSPALAGSIDVAQLCMIAFFVFFFGLVIYLRREDRREGYPLEDEITGKLQNAGGVLSLASPKTFKLAHGHGSVQAPVGFTENREPVAIAARRTARFPGAPLEPTGNPLVDGIGPASFANRAKRPDVDWEGHARIVPIGAVDGLYVERRDVDPRGFTVLGADHEIAGKVTDLWVDRADRLIRYLQVDLPNGRSITVPFNVCIVVGRRSVVRVDAITAAQFLDVPATESNQTITLYEEDRIQGYFGGGYLYAMPERTEPML